MMGSRINRSNVLVGSRSHFCAPAFAWRGSFGRPRAKIPPAIAPSLILFSLLVFAVAMFGTGCVGCASSALPPRLSSAERARLKGAHLPFTVGVERFESPGYSESLRKALQRTRLFDRVDDLDRFSSPPSLVARVERRVYGSTALPFGTLLTFGLVPMFTQEEHGESFSLTPPDCPEKRVLIEYTYQGRTTLGWIALFEGLHPDVTVFPFDLEQSRRFRGRLALAILDHAEALRK